MSVLGGIRDQLLSTISAGDFISGDGTTLFGRDAANSIFNWRLASGAAQLNATAGLKAICGAANGNTMFFDGSGGAFQWTSGASSLVQLFPTQQSFAVECCSVDGKVAVGSFGLVPGVTAFRWTSAGSVNLGHLHTWSSYPIPLNTTWDGNTILGVDSNFIGENPFVWTASKGIQNLQDVVGLPLFPEACSSDGTILVGFDPYSHNTYEWTPSRGLSPLDVPLGPLASASSADCDVLVFDENSLWTPDLGLIPFPQLMAEETGDSAWAGVDFQISSISVDGQTVSGTIHDVQFPYDNDFPFVAHFLLPPVCNPISMTVLENGTLAQSAPGVLRNDYHFRSASVVLVKQPSHAQAFNLNSDGSFSYKPTAGFTGNDSFTYYLSKSGFSSNLGTATITVSPFVLSVASQSVYGGTASVGTVQSYAPAPAGGLTIALSSSNSLATTPSSVTIPAGATKATFGIGTKPANTLTQGLIGGSTAGVGIGVPFNVTPPRLAKITAPSSIVGGNAFIATAYIVGIAGSNGVTISIFDQFSYVNPPSVVVLPGQSSAQFLVSTHAQQLAQTQPLGLFLQGNQSPSVESAINLLPASLTAASMPTQIVGGNTATLTLQFDGATDWFTSSDISSSSADATIGNTSGSTDANFRITAAINTVAVAQAVPVTLTIVYNGVTKKVNFTIEP